MSHQNLLREFRFGERLPQFLRRRANVRYVNELVFFIMLFFLGFGLFETFFQIAQRLKAMAFVFADPALVDLVQRHRIEIMQLLAPAPDDGDQVCRFQQQQMLGHRLPRHVEVFAQFAQRLPVALVQFIEQLSAARIRQRFEHCIHLRQIMQPFGCMSNEAFSGIFRHELSESRAAAVCRNVV